MSAPAPISPLTRNQLILVLVLLAAVSFATVLTLVLVFGHPFKGEAAAANGEDLEAQSRDGSSSPSEAAPEPSHPVIGYLDREPAFDDTYFWQIPVDAPIETFPIDPAPLLTRDQSGCTDEQLAWLEEYALLQPLFAWGDAGRTFLLSLTNDVSSDTMTLSNIHFEGEEVPSVPWIQFECPQGGVGESFGELIYVDAAGNPAVAGPDDLVFVPPGDFTEPLPEGTPLTFDMAAGESGELMLTRAPSVDASKQYYGRFLADAAGAPEDTVVLAEDITFWPKPVAGHWMGYGTYSSDGTLMCMDGKDVTEATPWDQYPDPQPYSLQDVRSLLEQMRGAN